MINRYNDFILEKNLELIKESIIYFSPSLRTELEKIQSKGGILGEIASSLLSLRGTNPTQDITFIDIDSTEGLLNYKKMSSMMNHVKEIGFHETTLEYILDTETNYDPDWADFLISTDAWKRGRNPIKLGKLINTFFPGKFTAGDIEKFTDKFKAIQRKKTNPPIEVIEGDEIIKWYNQKNYMPETDTLLTSCMRYDSCASYFSIYTENPDVCKMVCLFDEDEEGNKKLSARAVLWQVSHTSVGDFGWFMDRQYGSIAGVGVLRNWAEEKGYAYKTYNSHSTYRKVTHAGKDFICSMEVELKQKNYRHYPYMDTFRRFDPETCTLYNDEEEISGHYHLDSTSGGKTECAVGRWSDYYDEYIPEDEAVYSEAMDDYIWADSSVELVDGSIYPQGHKSVRQDAFTGEYIHIDDSIYSDFHDGYILEEDAISVVYEVDAMGECNSDGYYINKRSSQYANFDRAIAHTIWFDKLYDRKEDYWQSHEGVLRELIEVDSFGNWILKKMKIDVYKCEDNEWGFKYLDEGASLTLGIKIDDNPIYWDIFGYIRSLEVEIKLEELNQKAEEHLNSLAINLLNEKSSIRKFLRYIQVYTLD